ncbi:serine/threonine protein kinase [Clostridium sp. YIM B02505]|uniref:Serine/threonine protein kinase n=1 Tax=Clostridium yunnanense TaxID=2800325 RepID=A0ABS1EP84_9CLOT|nr:serine/threonine protein kinase [Clostridium yunnanense]MBK1811166.1 serine/threonine protein kinase [Clostridium yunnanense]
MIKSDRLNKIINLVENELLPLIDLKSIDIHDPVVVEHIPTGWDILGTGNYAAVLSNTDFPEYAIKVYADGRPGIEEEIEAYKRLGSHNSYSECFYYGKNFLILKRLNGITIYEAIVKGIQIPEKVIKDIDNALDYARSRNLHPHDVHFKNVMIKDGHGIVVDISDFCKAEHCLIWEHSKKAYYNIYIPLLYKLHLPIPNLLLNFIRKCYQFYKKIMG